jgi:hypothetical protein
MHKKIKMGTNKAVINIYRQQNLKVTNTTLKHVFYEYITDICNHLCHVWLHVVKANTLFSPLIFSIVIIANGICDYVHDYIISNGIMEGIPNLATSIHLLAYLITYLPILTYLTLPFLG